MISSCQVVITGVGVISPLGLNQESLWNSLLQRRSGVRVREEFADSLHPFRISAPVHDFEPREFVRPRKALKVMCRPIQFGFAASTMATDAAGISEQIDPDRFCTVFGTEAFYADPKETARVFRKCMVNRCYDHDRWGDYAMREIEPLWMLKYLPNMVASHISIACDARGPSNTICQSEVSSLLAMIEACDLIQRGAADAVVTGGTGSLMTTTGMIYRGTERLSKRIMEPEKASRPFDAARDGMVVGEGSGALVLEREDFARARGAKPLAKVLGYARSYFPRNDQFADAIAHNLSLALQRAGITPDDVGHINAQGCSTQQDDVIEAQAINKVFGDAPVIAPTGNIGNIGPGTGVIELAASIECCRNGMLPPAINYDQPDPQCPVNLVNQDGMTSDKPIGITTNFTETGQITSLVISA